MIYGDSQNILLNLKMLFDSLFLRDGHFFNVAKGDTIRNVDISKLIRDPSSDSYFIGISGAQVWQSPYQEWIYESGITLNDAPFISGLPPPVVASGIYVNGTFFAQNAGVSGHAFKIDYINGRIIFADSGIPNSSLVQAVYAYRFFRVDVADKHARQDIKYHSELELKDNPFSNGNELYPSGGHAVGTIPAIFLELGESSREAYELGNRSAIVNQPITCHIYTYDAVERDTMLDLLSSRWHIQMPMVDFNYAPFPLSGLYSTLSPAYIPYQTLLENVQFNGSKVISKYFVFDELRAKPIEPLINLERGVVDIDIKIYNIAPTGRIPINPYI